MLMSSSFGVGLPTALHSQRLVTFSSVVLEGCSLTCNAALLIFDHSITFIQEVDLFWKPKLTGAAVLFFLNRSIVLITVLLNTSGIFYHGSS